MGAVLLVFLLSFQKHEHCHINKVEEFDPQTGFAPAIWNTWVNNWTGQEPRLGSQTRPVISTVGRTTTTNVFRDTTRQIFDTGVATRTGTQTAVVEQFENESLGDRVLSRDVK